MLLDEGMDTGDMLKKAELMLDPKETTGSLFDKLSIIGAETLIPVLHDLPSYVKNAEPQDESQATYTAKISKEMAALDRMQLRWNGLYARSILSQVRISCMTEND